MQYDDGAGYAAEVVDRSITATKAICGECIAGTDDAWTSSAPFTGTTGSWCTIKVHRSGRLYADQSRCRSRLRPRTHSSCSPIVRHKGGLVGKPQVGRKADAIVRIEVSGGTVDHARVVKYNIAWEVGVSGAGSQNTCRLARFVVTDQPATSMTRCEFGRVRCQSSLLCHLNSCGQPTSCPLLTPKYLR
jgi:hypothetical protein